MKNLEKPEKYPWHEIDLDLKKFEETLPIPDGNLQGVSSVILQERKDFLEIPQSGGTYWIWTNEPFSHSFHCHRIPAKFDGGEIVYNGISKDNIRGRIIKHLLGRVDEGMSGISTDLLLTNYKGSHRKKALTLKGNTAYINNNRIRTKNQLLKLHLSDEEKEFVLKVDHDIYFRNGINITEKKHQPFLFKVFFLCEFKSASYGDIIEKNWREKNGLPRFCTYRKGR